MGVRVNYIIKQKKNVVENGFRLPSLLKGERQSVYTGMQVGWRFGGGRISMVSFYRLLLLREQETK